jgi:predicted dehydrogenase
VNAPMNNELPTLRWAVIGLGRFGRIHAEVLRTFSRIELAAVCARDASRVQPIIDGC